MILVLWRQPDTLTLWGIPYKMRPGQSPYDLWKARRDYIPPKSGHYGSPVLVLDGWIVVPEGRYNQKIVPENPCEWSEVTDADLKKEGA